jgi:hypothetical protein
METYFIEKDIPLIGRPVASFPAGIAEMFEELMNLLPDGRNRNWFGLSKMADQGKILYIAAAEERAPNEASLFECQSLTIEKGTYLSAKVQDWTQKTDCIKDIFAEMMMDPRFDASKYCVEWYQNDRELLCLLSIKPIVREP